MGFPNGFFLVLQKTQIFVFLLPPVTNGRSIADGEENRLFLPFGLLKCFRSPRGPNRPDCRYVAGDKTISR
jgi:hypothetical protein